MGKKREYRSVDLLLTNQAEASVQTPHYYYCTLCGSSSFSLGPRLTADRKYFLRCLHYSSRGMGEVSIHTDALQVVRRRIQGTFN